MHTGAGESFCFPQPNVDNGISLDLKKSTVAQQVPV